MQSNMSNIFYDEKGSCTCLNGGWCIVSGGCECTKGFSGERCESIVIDFGDEPCCESEKVAKKEEDSSAEFIAYAIMLGFLTLFVFGFLIWRRFYSKKKLRSETKINRNVKAAHSPKSSTFGIDMRLVHQPQCTKLSSEINSNVYEECPQIVICLQSQDTYEETQIASQIQSDVSLCPPPDHHLLFSVAEPPRRKRSLGISR